MDRESGEVSHSSNARSWQRLHLFALGNTLSKLGFTVAEFWARPRSTAVQTARTLTAITTTARSHLPTAVIRVTTPMSLRHLTTRLNSLHRITRYSDLVRNVSTRGCAYS